MRNGSTSSLMPPSPPLQGLGDVGSVIRARRLALLGHLARIGEAGALRAKDGAVPSPGWHRPRGRPRHTWVDHGKEDVAVPLNFEMLLAAHRQALRSLHYGPLLTKHV